jgi:predicted nuclease of predicted toxin-antitoxin system
MRLLLDEMLSPAIAQELRSRGHDVLAVAGDRDREGMSDPDIMALARNEHRAVVTNNLCDYRPLHHEAITPGGPGHYGMIFMPGTYRRTKADTGRIIAALQRILAQYPGEEDLANGESWL